ncbi:MAG: STAS domain-containing protein [Eubacteriales bacterium]
MVPGMNVQLLYKDGVLTAKMSGEIDHHSAQEIREAIDDTSQKVKPYCLRMDFSGVPFMDSSDRADSGRVRLYNFWKGHVVLCGLSPNLNKMVELSGIGSVASIERRAG